MSEQIIHALLLALHNIALVGCAAAPFYNGNLVRKRGQYGPKLNYELDKVVEDTIQGTTPYCVTFIITLFVTGLAIPFNHYVFHGVTANLHMVANAALAAKLVCVFGMVAIMAIIFLKINPKLRALFADFTPSDIPDAKNEATFFALRKRRKELCDKCLIFALGVLVFSAFLGFKL